MTEESRKDPLINFSETPEAKLVLDLAKGEGRSLPSNIAGLDRIQKQLDQQVALLAELDAEIAQVVGWLDQTISYQKKSLRAEREVDRLKEKIAARDARLKQKIAERDAKEERLKAQLSAIQASPSWRAAAMLRSISAGLQRLAHTIRRAFKHVGGRHGKPTGESPPN
jgi:hypothetical protein